MKNLKTFEQFHIISESMDDLEKWKEMMDKYDLRHFRQFQTLSNKDLEQMREEWKAIRRNALAKLNKKLNDSGKSGQLLNIDVSDDELYPYVDEKYKSIFFKYSRILDFSGGYIPKNMKLIKK